MFSLHAGVVLVMSAAAGRDLHLLEHVEVVVWASEPVAAMS
jgi:hypothetical protein